MSFEQFMREQVRAIEESGLPPDAWIEQNAEEFRLTHVVEEMGD